ncbi:3-hydroxyphenylacetate 6-hydroxylase [Hypsizygus marmoreus]|uniref:3-hydroxyphenylacetate 6-hydroxylase n=1 Tax=Hypsizygus marmoreus TaxID=39966 RepID=A0A369K2B9_HYPMA|nr:3-hydroxyphenylacetate 6-hydroxylase [Hypsizygus marmoreus]
MSTLLEQGPTYLLQSPLATGAVVVAVLLGLISWSTTPPNAPDLPGPKGWPIVGSLFQRGKDPASTYQQWAKIYGPVFRMRLANKWVVVINGAEAGDELVGSAQYGSIFQSRPMPHTLGKLLGLASKKAVTLGTSPYDDLLKGKRRLSIASVSPAATKTYENIIERAAQYFVRGLNNANKQGGPIDAVPIFFDAAAVLAITVLCGASVEEASVLLNDIPYPMKRLGQIRNINGHYRDFFPILRVLPPSKLFREAVEVAKYRNGKLTFLLNRCKREYEEGTAQPCAAVSVLRENKQNLSDESLTSVSNSMVSSGLDSHMPNTLLWGLGLLASNKDMQEKAYDAIISQEKLGDAMNIERDNYLFAFVKEMGRYFTTFRLALARETIGKDLVWKGHYIPEGTTVYTNCHAMNRDPARFVNPEKFWPERFMSGPEAERTMPHYGFGIGRRNCPAMNLVHKEIYTVYKRILLNWSIELFDGEREFDAVRGCADGLEFNQAPKPYRIKLTVRDQQKLDAYLNTEL